jgi:hypothetical protein
VSRQLRLHLGVEIKGGPQAAIHVKRDGRVLVDDAPSASIPMQAHGCAHSETDRPVRPLRSPAKPVESMAEGEVATDAYPEIARLTIYRSFPCVEPRLLCL